MTIPDLCIIQARLHSTRLPQKMLLTLGGETLIARAWSFAVAAFGKDNCVVAIPAGDVGSALGEEVWKIGASWDAYDGDEQDVLGRFAACAHARRWHQDSVIFRYTPDDAFKDIDAMRRVANGERLPVELGGEAFTLAMLDEAHAREPEFITPEHPTLGSGRIRNPKREHISDALFPFRLPPMEGEGWTIDTEADYEAAKQRMAS